MALGSLSNLGKPILKEVELGELKENEEAPKETPKVVDEEKKDELAPVVEMVVEKKEQQLSARGRILLEYNGVESDIPINHAYWHLKG